MFYFIVNPHASDGKGLRVWQKVQKKLPKLLNAQRYEVFLTEKSGDARDFSRKITERCRESKTLIVIGGDGTLNEVVDGSCFDTDNVAIAFIPTGVTNDFARYFRKKINLNKRIQQIFMSSEEKRMDYGLLNAENGNRRFVVSAGIGFDAAIFHELLSERCKKETSVKRGFRSERIRYIFSFMKALKGAKRSKGYLLLDQERRIEFNNIIFISAHVHPYEAGYLLGSGADCNDGYLDLCIVSTKHKFRVLRIMFGAIFGVHKNMKGVHCYRCKEVEIHTEELLPVHVDGENFGELRDVFMNCVPGKLRVKI